ncbi:MAG: FAD-dependent thymidylate synthase [Planctomycetes bacterium]|nr:FAD-dependent thymidylate synthase [Planctomycetota bacterium]
MSEESDVPQKEEAQRVQRVPAPELDAVLGVPFKVLDDGFIRCVDYMGSDASIVQAARVSYGSGTKKVNEDRGLIRYLLRHRHTTPFEMCEIKFHVRVPMDCWRQWIRHRTANVNEYSTRYSIAIDASQRTDPGAWRTQSTDSKQGSAGFLEKGQGEKLSKRERELQEHARDVYNERLALGIAREQARKDLPLSTYTEAYWKVDLHNLLHFIALRMDAHAQLEIREYAKVLGHEFMKRWCPIAWEAFMDYRFEGMHLTRIEIEIMQRLGAGKTEDAQAVAQKAGWLERSEKGDKPLKRNRERAEFEGKLKSLNMAVPWK